MNKEKDPAPMFKCLTTGVVKGDFSDKAPKIRAHGCLGPGVVRKRMASIKPSDLKSAKDDAEYGLVPGAVKKGKKQNNSEK